MTSLPYSFNRGEFECAALHDGGFMGIADFLSHNAAEDQLKSVMDGERLDPTQLPSSWTCLLISDGTHRLLTFTAEENATILLFHMDFPSRGYVTPEAGGWRWQPIGE